ncbi:MULTISPECIES: FMN-binding protein [Clostridia]|uniref:FMN-binding protein n=1 Tax=Clostridia TaxID=186801 RepID=UPI001314B058|nr:MULTISPECIES: FMN-binding protein [Clostridia]
MKKDKKTEVDPENLDPKNQKKKINLSTMAPALSALLVVACAGASVAAYSPKVYAVQKPSPKTESADTTAEDTAEETALEGQVFDLPDGIYEGTGTGFAGKITVAVEIKDKKIVAITVLNVEADDAAFFNRAKGVIDRIIQSQNLDVDVVSGATYSSRGIISAVKNALTGEKDSGKTAENPGKGEGSTTVAQVADAAAYKDGTYYGSATGFAGPIKVKVVISGGKIASIEIVSTSDGSSYISKASAITGKIVSSQSTNVDTVSGATYSSVGIINAVRNALAQAAVDGSTVPASTENTEQNNQQNQSALTPSVSGNFPYPDGTYYGTAEGYLGDVKVAIVLKNHTIQSVQILENEDDAAFFNRARAVVNNIVKNQTTGVDVVSGATYSSNGIINAVKAALESAKAAANPSNGNNSNNGNQNNNNSGNNNGNTGNNNNSNNNGSTEKPDDSNTNAPTYYADGSYTVTVKCEPDESEDFDAYNLTATITVKGDKITAISNVSGDGDSSNDRYINWAANGRSNNVGIISQIIGLATIDMSKENAETTMNEAIANVDVVSRATCSSKALKDACKEALNQARAKFLEQKDDQKNLADVKMPDGTDETGNADTELTDPENDPQEAAQEQLLETE